MLTKYILPLAFISTLLYGCATSPFKPVTTADVVSIAAKDAIPIALDLFAKDYAGAAALALNSLAGQLNNQSAEVIAKKVIEAISDFTKGDPMFSHLGKDLADAISKARNPDLAAVAAASAINASVMR